MIEESDLKIVAQAQAKLNQGDILKMYVKNWGFLDLKSRRKVMGHIQAQRSKHAKEVFLKELSSIGQKINQQQDAKDDSSLIRNKKDPLKLRLEAITGSIEPRS